MTAPVELPRVGELGAHELDAARVTALAKAAGVDTICVWAQTACPGRVRDLCAAIGALEESASGTTAAALALYLKAHDRLHARELAIEQGVEMGRPSRVDLTVEAPDTATVRGRARTLLSGPVELGNSDGP